MPDPTLVTIELRFRTQEDVGALADRIRESVRLIVGTEALEDFRVRDMPLAPPKRGLRGV